MEQEIITSFSNERWLYVDNVINMRYMFSGNGYKQRLYHYTTSEVLTSILNAPALWLTHHEHLDDTSEYEYGAEFYNQLFDFYTSTRSTFNLHLAAIKERIGEKEKQLFNRSIFYFNQLQKDYCFVTMSFSTKANDLSQWREYANDATGIALSAKMTDLISTLTKSQYIKNELDGFISKIHFVRPKLIGRFLHPALYEKGDYSEILYSNIDRAIELIQNDQNNKSLDIDSIIDGYAKTIAQIGLYYSSIIKSPHYAYEREYRIVEFIDRTSFERECKTRINKKGREVKYLELHLSKEDILSIYTKVLLGPAMPLDKKNEIKNLCQQQGIEVEVSDIPYR